MVGARDISLFQIAQTGSGTHSAASNAEVTGDLYFTYAFMASNWTILPFYFIPLCFGPCGRFSLISSEINNLLNICETYVEVIPLKHNGNFI